MLSLLAFLALAADPAVVSAERSAAAADAPPLAAPALAAPNAPAVAPVEPSKPKRLKLLVLDVKAANAEDVDAGEVDTLTSFIANRAARFPFDVVSSADIRDMLELEGQKQAAGCDTAATSCLGEIAGALGADLVLSTRAGKLDAVYVIALQLFDARAATGEGRASVEAWSLGEASTKIGPAVDELLMKATGAAPTESVTAAAHAPDSALAVDDNLRFGLKVGGGAAVGLGVVAAVLGAVPAVLYSQRKAELGVRTTRFADEDAGQSLPESARIHQEALDMKALYNDVGHWALLGGVALAIAGGAMVTAGFLLPAPGASTPSETGGAP